MKHIIKLVSAKIGKSENPFHKCDEQAVILAFQKPIISTKCTNFFGKRSYEHRYDESALSEFKNSASFKSLAPMIIPTYISSDRFELRSKELSNEQVLEILNSKFDSPVLQLAVEKSRPNSPSAACSP